MHGVCAERKPSGIFTARQINKELAALIGLTKWIEHYVPKLKAS